MLTVSILTPIYGVEKYIEQCARSLLEQSYAHIEYIFVNDCTPDRSMEILRSLIAAYPERAKQVKIIEHNPNQGVGAARQDALMAATGDYLMFVDSDDFLPKHAVENLVEKAYNYKNINKKDCGKTTLIKQVEKAEEMWKTQNDCGKLPDLVDGGYAEWSNGQASLPQKPFQEEGEKYLKLLICQNIITNRLWGRIYKRSLIMEHKIFFEKGINYAEDLFWNSQVLFYAKKTTIDDVVYYYRTDNLTSYCHDISEKNLLSYFKSTRRLIDFFEAHDPAGTYRPAIEIGVVNAYRWAAQAKVNLEKVDKALGDYAPKSLIIRGVIRLIKRGLPVKWVNLVYLSYRRFYAYFA